MKYTVLVAGALSAFSLSCAAGASAASTTAKPARPSYCDTVDGNLVSNCGFETGDFTYWTLTDNYNGYTNVSTTPHTGTYAANFANINQQDAHLSQTLQATPKTVYDLSYWIKSTDQGHLSVTVAGGAGGSRVFDDSEQRGGLDIYPYTHVLHHFRTDSTGTVTVTFSGMNHDGYTFVDDVSIAPKPA